MEVPHRPVLVQEVVRVLSLTPGGIYVDGTVGGGGHSAELGKTLPPGARLVCLDRDPEAVCLSGKRLGFLEDRVTLVQANFADIDRVLEGLGVEKANGVLLDLGMSSYQLDKSGRGFSFSRDEPLDMRMDPGVESSARDLVNRLSRKDLEATLRIYGEEKRAKSIARAIVKARAEKRINTTRQLASLIESVFPPSQRRSRIHVATRSFQALRIAVNRELENLETFLEKIPSLMETGGRLVVLSYHSLEDRIVKRAMAGWSKGCSCPPDFPVCTCGGSPLFALVRKRGLRPSQDEVDRNPRARSAMLRVAERV